MLATVSDRKIAVSSNGSTIDSYTADVVSAQDYYPFGMLQPGRSYNTGGYRYGFNGKENDNEVKGEGNQQDYGMRIYDPRLGRFLSVDPLTKSYPHYTPYSFAGNKPIQYIDLDGLEEVPPQRGAIQAATPDYVIRHPILAGIQTGTYLFLSRVGLDFIDDLSYDVVHAGHGDITWDEAVSRTLARMQFDIIMNGSFAPASVPSSFPPPTGGLMPALAGAEGQAIPLATKAMAKPMLITPNMVTTVYSTNNQPDAAHGNENSSSSNAADKPNPYLNQTRNENLKSKKTYEDLVKEHEEKLADYKKDPQAADNQGRLKAASNDIIREKL